MLLTVLLDQSCSAQLLWYVKIKMLSRGFNTVSDLADLDIRSIILKNKKQTSKKTPSQQNLKDVYFLILIIFLYNSRFHRFIIHEIFKGATQIICLIFIGTFEIPF